MIKRLLSIMIVSAMVTSCGGASKDDAAQENKSSKNNAVPKITVSADRAEAHVGDLINLSIKYFIPEGSSFAPDTDLTGLDGLTITKKQSTPGEINLTILADKTASFDIGPISLSFKDSKGILTIIRSEAAHIEILSNLGDKPAEAQLKPIMDIIPTYPFILRLLPWIVLVLLLGGAVAGFYIWKKMKRVKAEELMNAKPAHVTAKEEIEKLYAMNLVDKGRYKDFYFRFSEILRRYIESLRGFPAVDMTTEEIGRRLKDEIDRKLMPVLREADLVKFADAIPTKARNEDDIAAALDYITATTPEETVIRQ